MPACAAAGVDVLLRQALALQSTSTAQHGDALLKAAWQRLTFALPRPSSGVTPAGFSDPSWRQLQHITAAAPTTLTYAHPQETHPCTQQQVAARPLPVSP